MEDVTEIYPPSQEQLVTSPSEHNQSNSPQNVNKKDKPQDKTQTQEGASIKLVEKETTTNHNAKTQSDKPFDLEAEIGKLKIAIPLSELAKHDIYK